MEKFISLFKNLDKDTHKIMNYGLFFSGLVILSSVAVLFTYIFLGTNFLYHLGLALLKSGFSFAVEFIICGIVVDFIRKQEI